MESDSSLRREFPTLLVSPRAAFPDMAIRARDWRSRDFDVYAFDFAIDTLDEAGDFALHIVGGNAALEIATRCQRAIGRRNAHSATPRFDAVLAAHRAMHDLAKPLVRADYNHARDTWQWLLRLAPEASLPLQLAALFHDIERLFSEADERIEHRAPDYQAFKNRHAAKGAELARAALQDLDCADRVAQLITRHEERAAGDPEVDVLNDADALSFFSLNSTGFADYFGPEHTRRKIDYTLARLGSSARRHLHSIHLRSDVRELCAS